MSPKRALTVLVSVTLLALAAPGRAQAEDLAAGIGLLVRDASRSLQSGNAALFLAAFDRDSFVGYEALRQNVTALTAQRRIASSVAVGAPRGGPAEWTADVDWLLELTPKLDPGQVERRREQLNVRVRKRGKKWKIVHLEPSGFFASSPRE